MAKRFTDTNKYRKPFIRNLPGPYKLFWDYLYHDCDHAGVWIVDMDIAQIYIGPDMPIKAGKALELFNADEKRVVVFGNGKKWFVPSFITFQYGELNEKNRAHLSVLNILKRHGLTQYLESEIKPLISPLQGAMDKEQDKEMDKDKGGVGENHSEPTDTETETALLAFAAARTEQTETLCKNHDIQPRQLKAAAQELVSHYRAKGEGFLPRGTPYHVLNNWLLKGKQFTRNGSGKPEAGERQYDPADLAKGGKYYHAIIKVGHPDFEAMRKSIDRLKPVQ